MQSKLAIVVLLFKKEISDSKTLSTLLASNLNFQNCKLTVWNNGPDELSNKNLEPFILKGFEVEVIETIENESLAKIYNRFINTNVAQKYIVLDDDTQLNDSYLGDAFSLDESQVGIPLILFNGKVEGPKINYKVVQSTSDECKNNDDILAIGSGLVIGCEVAEALKSVYKDVFDSKFYLYGVDTTFCYRLNGLKQNKNLKLLSGLNHSLSRLESEPEAITAFRAKERGYDVGLQWRYYSPFYKSIYRLLRLALINLQRFAGLKKGPLDIHFVLKAYCLGRHYRITK
ncbi:hypothetical protein EU510_10185 [Pseudoalteromonas sp. FUC4]|uniref:hypothetical protein n=1 Tax=Pseudoalteromonas sp. FUC4 TaxID=2511201 RepID=UPI0011F12425|nr:hypothetical protein [Pseudoalteromonas sp. FUC4]KAA1152430.1 hypothetical protein EU510_10185 [Pseudoalteromonas sp. FUC4]